MTFALTFWLAFGTLILGPYDTGFRLPTEAACQDIIEVVKAAALDAVPLGAPKFALVLVCTPLNAEGVPA